jgi:hypothetical protein
LVSIQGTVEVRQGKRQWEAVRRLDTALRAGDLLRTGRSSWAALFITPENLLRISISSDEKETMLVFSQDRQPPPTAGELRNAGNAGRAPQLLDRESRRWLPLAGKARTLEL